MQGGRNLRAGQPDPERQPAIHRHADLEPGIADQHSADLVALQPESKVTVRYDAGTLHWQEAGAPEDTITPGVYTVTATLAGYTLLVTPYAFNCEAGRHLHPDPDHVQTDHADRQSGATSGAAPTGALVRLTVGSTLISEQVATATSVTFTGLSTTRRPTR